MANNLAWCGSHHFYSNGGSGRTCIGDSGGPYIVNTGSFDAIVGVHANSEHSSAGPCAKDGGKQRAVRMNRSKVDWIQGKGYTCSEFAQNGHPYFRCS